MDNIQKIRIEQKYLWGFLIFMWVLLLLEWVVEFGYIKNRLEKAENKLVELELKQATHKHKLFTGDVYDTPRTRIRNK